MTVSIRIPPWSPPSDDLKFSTIFQARIARKRLMLSTGKAQWVTYSRSLLLSYVNTKDLPREMEVPRWYSRRGRYEDADMTYFSMYMMRRVYLLQMIRVKSLVPCES